MPDYDEHISWIKKVLIWPHVDKDITFTYTSGKITQIEVTSFSRTKTLTLSWTGDQLDSIVTVLT